MNYPLTCISGFWQIKNKHGNKFLEWFKNTLQINCPYVFFATKEGIDLIKSYRKDLPTYYIECNIEDFYTYKYKDKMLTHPVHCPSVELNLIWNEKIILIEKAMKINPYNSEFFCWTDSGISTYRTITPPREPFPNLHKLQNLPKDKFIYSESTPFNSRAIAVNNYYHNIAGTSYILHKDIIHNFTEMYKLYMDKIFMDDKVNKSNLWTDQVILTHIFKTFPHKFYKLCHGYGMIINELY
jgi:hypothetical protein